METLFNKFVVFKLAETVSNTFFADQKHMLTFFKQVACAQHSCTIGGVLQAALLTFSANKDTFFNHVFLC